MSDMTRELIPIIVMYGFVLLLIPFIAVTMWAAFDGDRLRDDEVEEVTEVATSTLTTQPEAREALGAA